MAEDRVQIFTQDGFRDPLGNFRWGWQCFTCGDEEVGYRNATTANEAADNHAALCAGLSHG